jgi:mannosyltransferase OCH1-like enzyme
MIKLALFFIAVLSPLAAWDVQHVDFDVSMRRNYRSSESLMQNDPRWHLLRRMWQTYQQQGSLSNGEYIIPPVIHFIWLGSPLPARCRAMVATWRHFHPDWTIKIWTDADVKGFGMQNQAAFDRARNYGEKSDIWRYEILFRFGGLYVDTDFECLKPFDRIHKSCAFYTGIGYRPDPILFNGLIGSVPGHPIIKLCVEALKIGSGDQNDRRIMNDTGPEFFTRCFFQRAASSKRVVAFPVTFFYPFPNNKRVERKDIDAIKRIWALSESYAIHYWELSWLHKPAKH